MLQIIFAQCNTSHPPNFQYIIDRTNDWWLLTHTHTPAYYMINGKKVLMPAHSVILYPPNSYIEYGSVENENYSDDWLRFQTDEPYICNGNIPFCTPFKTMEHLFISDLISMLASENFFDNQFREFTIQSLFQILFCKLRESLSNKTEDFREIALQQLHMNIQNNPSFPWNVPDMAKQLYISERHLQKLYHKRYGISCMEDVIMQRLLLAKKLLCSSSLPIYKIAEDCGYLNTEHFSRQFKKQFGISPKVYRETNQT